MIDAITVVGVSHSYDGRGKAVDDASFSVPQGGITALIGPNGSGKSTMMKMILGLFELQSGVITTNPNVLVHRNSVSYSPEVFSMFPHATVTYYLMLAGQLRGLGIRASRMAAGEILEKVGLTALGKLRIFSLSKGNRQKIQLLACFVSRPKLAFFDEPWSGLDPENQEEMAKLITESAAGATTVLLTGHHLGMIERTCSSIIAMKLGKIVAHGTADELLRRMLPNKQLAVSFAHAITAPPATLGGFEVKWDTLACNAMVQIPAGADMSPLISAAGACGRILDINTRAGTLHDAYLTLYRDVLTNDEDA